MTVVPGQHAAGAPPSLNEILSLSAGWYWEQDASYRFSLLDGQLLRRLGLEARDFLGRTWWDLGAMPIDGQWQTHWDLLAKRATFTDFITRFSHRGNSPRFIISAGMPNVDDAGRFLGYRGISRDITTFWRGEQLLKLEHAITRHLVEAAPIGAALREVIRILCLAEGWACGVFWEPLGLEGALQSRESWMLPTIHPAARECLDREHLTIIRPGEHLPGWVAMHRQPLWVPDVSVDPRSHHRQLAHATGLSSAMLFPVLAQDRLLGVFGFTGTEVREPDAPFLEGLAAISDQIGLFIQRTQSDAVLRASEERFRNLTEFTSDWYWEQDAQFRFVAVAGKDIGDERFFLGKTHWDPLFRSEPDNISWAAHQERLHSHQPFHDLVLKSATSGATRYFAVSGHPIFDERGQFRGYRGIGKDITERKSAEARIQYLARHDSLTGLPNRAYFSELLNLFIHNAQRYQHGFAVLFIDLDRFKTINDTLGHEAGDLLLREMAQRLRNALRASDVVARLGGDEFVVLLPEVTAQNDITTTARKILYTLTHPVEIRAQECRMTASIGISRYPNDARDEQGLMKNADMAMYRAKEKGKNTHQFFSDSMRTQSLERLALETSLRRALERGEFLLHYQAKRNLRTGLVHGVEALLRWQHPDLGMVSPAQFIPLAEETGLIIPIGRWVLRTACMQNMAWQRAGLPTMSMAVNLSASQCADENLMADITDALSYSGMSPTLLELELTESMVMQNPSHTLDLLQAAKALGIQVAIDDFGTGYSSLSQLKHFPIDTLKIDRSFIRDLPQNNEDRAIAQAIIAMGKTLGLKIVAEGVETAEQEQFLRESACDESQGFYFSRPLPADQLGALLRQHVAAALP